MRRLLILLVVVLVLAVGGTALYLTNRDEPAPLTLGTTADTAPTSAGCAGDPPAPLAGAWRAIDSSVVGYRVREKLASLSAPNDAVGRTSDVTGTVSLAGSGADLRLTEGRMEADLRTLRSDSDRRDERIRTLGLESDRFPAATFVVIGPVAVPEAAQRGTPTAIPVTGDLTLHGVTRRVVISLQSRLAGRCVQLAGGHTFAMVDHGIVPPSIAGAISVENDATLEVQLDLVRA